LNAITDLQYSFKGDRLLSASQRDGVVRIWTWNFAASDGVGGHPTHVHIKLVNPNASSNSSSFRSRGRANRGTPSVVSCDSAAWVADDTRIVTSQCETLKANSNEIVPGSQYIFLWDSLKGHCLLGLADAHTMQCPVVVPHPIDTNLFCSAGADGMVKLWDWTTGHCLFSHRNTVNHGPVDPNDVGKACGYLQGSFSPTGDEIVLADDSGRVSVFDIRQDWTAPPQWMTEQYFANDYYELFYDDSGYCVELGSQQPPHVAPKGVRSNHLGSAWPEAVSSAFKDLVGGLPLTVAVARADRQALRASSQQTTLQLSQPRGNHVSQFDATRTKILNRSPEQQRLLTGSTSQSNPGAGRTALQQNELPVRTPRPLSTSYRWIEFSDLPDENDDEARESDDEEFRTGHESDDDADELHVQGSRFGRSSGSRRGRSRASGPSQAEEPTRVSSRLRRSVYFEDDASDEGQDLVMSTNNKPYGNFIVDYEEYMFKLPTPYSFVRRRWLGRMESSTSYQGLKSYVPQVGDTVVYIPRAHMETLNEYSGIAAPWHTWPQHADWPVVQCSIAHIRYRFPWQELFKQDRKRYVAISGNHICCFSVSNMYPRPPLTHARCESVVAILFVKVSGQLSDADCFSPEFVPVEEQIYFEVRGSFMLRCAVDAES
jgi:hypothetical protein